MTSKGKEFRIWVKTRMVAAEDSVTALAAQIGYPRRTVSAAINQGIYPHVLQAIATHYHHVPEKDGPLPARPARPERRVRTIA